MDNLRRGIFTVIMNIHHNQIKKLFFGIILTVLCFDVILCQNYIWPTEASRTITTVFGDVRPRRYHAGIDIRTYGQIGKEIYAVDGGYIERIRTSSRGYGKAVYIRLKDGKQAVYAHLSEFSPALNTTVKSLHNYYQKYTIDHYFDANSYPVRRGELIGYTGDTGTISGPHLHFEIRDENGNPMNPFLTNLKITDSYPPVGKSIAVIPLEQNTLVNGFHFPQVFPLKKQDNFHYILEDTITALGLFGLAVNITDKIDHQPFGYGIYSLELSVDDEILYSAQYDKFSFEEQQSIFFERDHTLKRQYNQQFIRLFTSEKMDSPSFVNSSLLSQLNLSEGFHHFEIEAKDFNNNFILIRGVITSFSVPEMEITLKTSDTGWNLVSIKTDKELDEQIHFTTAFPDESEILKPIQIEQLSGSRYRFKKIDPLFPIIKITGKDNHGIKTLPYYLSMEKTNPLQIDGTPEILHYENGVIIQYNETRFANADAVLKIQTAYSETTHPLTRIDKCTLTSSVLHPAELSELKSISFQYETIPEIIKKYPISGITTIPENEFELIDHNLNVGVSGGKNTFFDTTYVWMESRYAPPPEYGKIISSTVFIGPKLRPYRNEVKVEFRLSAIDSRDSSLAIYYYDDKMVDWVFMDTEFDPENFLLSTTALSGEIFSVISEKNPPVITTVIPNTGGTYTQSTLKSLSFFAEDHLSGIKDENNIQILLDNAPVIFEYNSYRKQIRYDLEYSLTLGQHELFIEIADNAGNKKTISGLFEVIP